MSAWFFEPLYPLFYEMLAVDPPWDHEAWSEKGEAKSQRAQYETMTDEEIFALPISQLASINAMLLLWSTAPRLDKAIKAVEAWGFTYQSYLIWRKVSRNGKGMMGPGHRVRTDAEIVIMATLGNPKQAWKPRTIFDGVRREHSRKPESFYTMCERMMPRARRADVFTRQSREGWHAWGKERTKFDDGDQPLPSIQATEADPRDVVDREVLRRRENQGRDLFSP